MVDRVSELTSRLDQVQAMLKLPGCFLSKENQATLKQIQKACEEALSDSHLMFGQCMSCLLRPPSQSEPLHLHVRDFVSVWVALCILGP